MVMGHGWDGDCRGMDLPLLDVPDGLAGYLFLRLCSTLQRNF